MLHDVSVGLLAFGFLGAGVFNGIGTMSTRADFSRWGYPVWWYRVTGGLEIVAALLIVLPAVRLAGLLLGAGIIIAATLTVVRHRDYPHLLPLAAFATLTVFGWLA
jgi:uncharacterized membrane protein YphA (DoxX/SURF4 family)